MTPILPTWTSASIGELANVVRGISFPATAKEPAHSPTNVCCLRTSNVQRELEWGDVYFVPRSFVKRDDQFVQPGDVLMSMANSYELVGKVAIAKEVPYPTAFGAFLSAVRPTAAIDGQYLFHLLRTSQVQSELRQGSSQTTNIANISVGKLSSIDVPLAPLAEQKRIADKLDTVLAHVDACRDRLERVAPLLKRFRQSVLAAATSGRLTEEWRLGAGAPSWAPTVLSELCVRDRVITYGVIKLGDDVPNGVPCLRTSNVRWLRVDTDGIKRIAPSLSDEYSRTVLRGGEILVNVRGTLGGVAVARPEMIGWNVSREVAVVPIDGSKVTSAFMALWIAAGASQSWLSKVEKGVAYVGVNIEDLRNLPVEVPSLQEQDEITRRIDQLFAFADRLEARLARAQTAADRLTPALLAKAFRGELVPQDPNDEPAAELLKPLHVARAKVPSKAKVRRSPSAAA